ncbi:winged helix-turn-helix transcriptional regulator [Bacillus mangrovi]|uniref:Winged helix-turn-helix transcriptional regulator n=1 Tax=Metabacillus mangrovi TaxID=1491830 RepID=A0A7X2S9P4_9BACI|nr:Lrp/AsnC family transcriptional regulator [Metabacillus mangrovi]MTH55676.1 winged helix-turn-helix transcriptional regulator [Metabacillus mangrovi]
MLDQTDRKILEELSGNGRMTMKELGARVHLTGQAAASRVARLEEEGFISKYTIEVNQQKLGYSIHAFLYIYTKSISHQPYLAFLDENKKDVVNHYKISGDGCYLMECRFSGNEELDRFLTGLNKHVNYKLSIVIK